jgi:hypothetical protein
MPRFRLIALVLPWLALTLTGCDLFSTRSAESPDMGRHQWEVPVEATDVLRNMSDALAQHDAVNYLRSFSPDSFVFEADAVALSLYPSLQGWDYSAESQMANQLFSSGVLPADSILAVVFSSVVDDPAADSTLIHADYDLTAQIAVSGVPRRMAGSAEFVLRKGRDSYWQIYRWRDLRAGEQPSWSEFKSLVALGR